MWREHELGLHQLPRTENPVLGGGGGGALVQITGAQICCLFVTFSWSATAGGEGTEKILSLGLETVLSGPVKNWISASMHIVECILIKISLSQQLHILMSITFCVACMNSVWWPNFEEINARVGLKISVKYMYVWVFICTVMRVL
jgi:hypothetical protein